MATEDLDRYTLKQLAVLPTFSMPAARITAEFHHFYCFFGICSTHNFSFLSKRFELDTSLFPP